MNGGAQTHLPHRPRRGSTFTFAIQGDSHPERTKNQFDPNLYTKTLLSAASIQPDFYMTIGDDFSVDTLKDANAETVRTLYINQRQWLGLVDAPVFLVNGNHEQASLANLDGTPNNVAVWAQTSRNAYYPQPAPDNFYTGNVEPVEFIGQLRDYYAFTWGDALFVVIDPYWHSTQSVDNLFGDGKPNEQEQKGKRDLWEVTLGDVQYQWFRQTLETSNAKYKFVFTHHVLGTGRGGIELADTFEWGDSKNLSQHRTWDKTIHQFMVDNNVTIFFQGHDHIFARQEFDGVIYQTLPEPANPFYSWENQQAYKSGDLFPNSGHVRVTVSPDGVTVDYVRSYLEKPDEVAFSYMVKQLDCISCRLFPSNQTLLLVLTLLLSSCAPQPTPSLIPPIEPTPTSSPTLPTPAPTEKPRGQNPPQDQGSDASQSLDFGIPTHPYDVILGRPTANSVTFSLLAYNDQTLSISYGTSSGNYASQTDPINLTANTLKPSNFPTCNLQRNIFTPSTTESKTPSTPPAPQAQLTPSPSKRTHISTRTPAPKSICRLSPTNALTIPIL
ncbi:MAG: metallophosphoesterase [Anaerolineales bacterium]|nr:metallophosphoesterase [Anaerolineales bacterium]